MERANTQSRDVVQEAFTVASDTPPVSRYGTFSDPEMVPVMLRQGYQDFLAVVLTVQASQFASAAVAEACVRKILTRTSTSRTFFVQYVDFTAVVVYKFILTDRDLANG